MDEETRAKKVSGIQIGMESRIVDEEIQAKKVSVYETERKEEL